jgi:hypothetical protein
VKNEESRTVVLFSAILFCYFASEEFFGLSLCSLQDGGQRSLAPDSYNLHMIFIHQAALDVVHESR